MKSTSSHGYLFLLTDSGGREYVRTHISAQQILVVEWLGFATPEMIRDGLLALLDKGPATGCFRVLHDYRTHLGSWTSLVEWIEGPFAQMVFDAVPFVATAYLVERNQMATSSAYFATNALQKYEHFPTATFFDSASAHDWLQRQSPEHLDS